MCPSSSFCIQPGDSLIQKIFGEGLAGCDLFLVVLSKASINSRWVREELDAATIRRIEGVTRIVPLLKEDTEIPLLLRALMWVDLRENVSEGVDRIVRLAYGVTDRPPRGEAPAFVSHLRASIGGLSAPATTVGAFLVSSHDPDAPFARYYDGEELAKETKLEPAVLNDAVDELEEHGLVTTMKYFGTAPFEFGRILPTYALYMHFKEMLKYDPQDDLRVVASAAVALDEANANEVQLKTQLSAGRLNRAVDYLENYGLLDVVKYMGTAPYGFGRIAATRHTRQFVH